MFRVKLSRFCKTPVYLMVNNGDEDSYDPTPQWKNIGELKADIQPYSGGLAQKEYGLTVECQKRIYTSRSELLYEGVYVRMAEEAEEPEYICMYAEHWDDYTMAILKHR